MKETTQGSSGLRNRIILAVVLVLIALVYHRGFFLGLIMKDKRAEARAVDAIRKLVREKKLEEAIVSARELVASGPTSSQPGILLSACLFVTGDAAGSERSARASLESFPDDPELLLRVAIALDGQKKHDEAQEAYEAVIAADPSNAKAQVLLGSVHYVRKRTTEAIACYKKAIELSPSMPGVHNFLGVAQESSGDLDGAGESYKREVEISPANPKALTNLGAYFHKKKKFDEARKFYKKALAVSPGFSKAKRYLKMLEQ